MKRRKHRLIKYKRNHRLIKYKRNHKRHFMRRKNKVYYSVGTRCTWKEKLPAMNNPNYILLYGIAPNMNDLSVEVFKQEYFKKPIELYTRTEHVKKIGAKQQSKVDRDMEVLTGNLNYAGVVIQKCNILETFTIADMIESAFHNQIIKNHVDEIKFISEYCYNNKIPAYAFPPKYEAVGSGLSTMKMNKPKAYIIVNPSIIVDVAIGFDNITYMVNKYTKQNESGTASKVIETPKQTSSTTIEKLKQAKSLKDLLNSFDRK